MDAEDQTEDADSVIIERSSGGAVVAVIAVIVALLALLYYFGVFGS